MSQRKPEATAAEIEQARKPVRSSISYYSRFLAGWRRGWPEHVAEGRDLWAAVRMRRVRPIGRLGPDDNDVAGPGYTVRQALILARQALPPAWLKLDEQEFHRLQRDYSDLSIALGSLDA